MRPWATAGLAAGAAVMCLALLSAISPGAGDTPHRERIVQPDPRGEALLTHARQLASAAIHAESSPG